MEERKRTEEQIRRILSYVDPSALNYNEWLSVGMALKNAGYSFDVWDSWSIDDAHTAERPAKWDGFAADGTGLKIGTVIKLAQMYGCPDSVLFPQDAASMFGVIGFDEPVTVSGSGQIRAADPPRSAQPRQPKRQNFRIVKHETETDAEARRLFLQQLFSPDETVCYESSIRTKKGCPGKYEPSDTARRRYETARALADRAEFFNYYQPAGMWLCVNPTDGNGRKIENITSWRWVLIESDEMPEEQQIDWLCESGLPIATICTSGGRSVHALVRVDAPDLTEYKRRTRLIFDWCDAHGFKIDKQTKNVNRLSRFPGFMRGDKPQEFLYWCDSPKTFEEWESETQTDQTETEEAQAVPLGNEFSVEPVRWLIPGAVPCGTFTLIGAAGGTGKSTLVRDIIAGLIRGTPCAFDWGRINPARTPKRVLLFNSEDDFSRITLPHLRALGCTDEDLGRLGVLPNTDARFPQIKYNSELLYQFIYSFRPDLIVFDPLQAFLPDSVDMAKRNQMRSVFQDLLAHLPEDSAVLIVCHFNKSLNYSGVDRIADSKDITDLARSVFLMGVTGEERDGDPLRYLSHEKSSYGRPLDTVLYQTQGRADCPGLWFFEPLESSRKKDADFSADKRRGSAEAPKPKKSDIAESLILSAVADEPKERNALIEEVQSAAREDYGADIGHTTIKNTLTRLEKAGELIRKTTGYGESKKSMFSTKNTDFGLLEE